MLFYDGLCWLTCSHKEQNLHCGPSKSPFTSVQRPKTIWTKSLSTEVRNVGTIVNNCKPDLLDSLLHRTIWEAVIGNCLKSRHFQKNILGRWLDEPSVNQTLAEASREKSKNVFSIEKSLQCHSLLLFRWRNTLQFWYNWCYWSIYTNLFRSRHCCLERTVASPCHVTNT